jgi:hypothetical protein
MVRLARTIHAGRGALRPSWVLRSSRRTTSFILTLKFYGDATLS